MCSVVYTELKFILWIFLLSCLYLHLYLGNPKVTQSNQVTLL